ncbi:MAG: sugar ABC transporter ATP-binding protein [Desulfurococcus sp.]|nr:sugar ABC transporter ATP-binding protein [Desulfurococcus sp.]
MIKNESKVVLEARSIVKKFPGIIALKGVDFDLYEGEVHALVGQNGAGKSTFVKILNGIHRAYSGEIIINGRKVHIRGPLDAKKYGITLVHQEITLLPNMSVAENIYLAKIPFLKYPLTRISKSALEDFSKKYIEILGLNIDPWIKVRDLSIGEQQLIQVARALAENANIICLDEPTSALTPAEVERLFQVIRELKESGKSIILITHHIDEVFRIADRVTVLRDGEKVATLWVEQAKPLDIVKLMLGGEIKGFYIEKEKKEGEIPVLKVENLATKPVKARGVWLRGITFDLRRGEILGVAGLLGAGKTELGKALVGMERIVNGRIFVENKEVFIRSPLDALKYGIYYLPEDRRSEGLVQSMSIRENIVLSSIDKLSRKLGLRLIRDEKHVALEWIKKLNIVAPSPEIRVANLSGGNQQKVVIAKALESKPKILIFDEPTMGIDIGAKVEIRKIIMELANQGLSVILMSSEIDEILALSDRILVLYKGRQVALLPNKGLTRDYLIDLVSGEGQINRDPRSNLDIKIA